MSHPLAAWGFTYNNVGPAIARLIIVLHVHKRRGLETASWLAVVLAVDVVLFTEWGIERYGLVTLVPLLFPLLASYAYIAKLLLQHIWGTAKDLISLDPTSEVRAPHSLPITGGQNKRSLLATLETLVQSTPFRNALHLYLSVVTIGTYSSNSMPLLSKPTSEFANTSCKVIVLIENCFTPFRHTPMFVPEILSSRAIRLLKFLETWDSINMCLGAACFLYYTGPYGFRVVKLVLMLSAAVYIISATPVLWSPDTPAKRSAQSRSLKFSTGVNDSVLDGESSKTYDEIASIAVMNSLQVIIWSWRILIGEYAINGLIRLCRKSVETGQVAEENTERIIAESEEKAEEYWHEGALLRNVDGVV